MGSGRLVLLAIAGLGAGVLVAAATTHDMRRISAPHEDMAGPGNRPAHKTGLDYAAQGAVPREHHSWMDEGLAALDMPAWPFGRAEWEGNEDTGSPTGFGDPAGAVNYGDGLHPNAASTLGPSIAEGNAAPSLAPGPAHDAAAEAAERAGAAATDAIAAESAVN